MARIKIQWRIHDAIIELMKTRLRPFSIDTHIWYLPSRKTFAYSQGYPCPEYEEDDDVRDTLYFNAVTLKVIFDLLGPAHVWKIQSHVDVIMRGGEITRDRRTIYYTQIPGINSLTSRSRYGDHNSITSIGQEQVEPEIFARRIADHGCNVHLFTKSMLKAANEIYTEIMLNLPDEPQPKPKPPKLPKKETELTDQDLELIDLIKPKQESPDPPSPQDQREIEPEVIDVTDWRDTFAERFGYSGEHGKDSWRYGGTTDSRLAVVEYNQFGSLWLSRSFVLHPLEKLTNNPNHVGYYGIRSSPEPELLLALTIHNKKRDIENVWIATINTADLFIIDDPDPNYSVMEDTVILVSNAQSITDKDYTLKDPNWKLVNLYLSELRMKSPQVTQPITPSPPIITPPIPPKKLPTPILRPGQRQLFEFSMTPEPPKIAPSPRIKRAPLIKPNEITMIEPDALKSLIFKKIDIWDFDRVINARKMIICDGMDDIPIITVHRPTTDKIYVIDGQEEALAHYLEGKPMKVRGARRMEIAETFDDRWEDYLELKTRVPMLPYSVQLF